MIAEWADRVNAGVHSVTSNGTGEGCGPFRSLNRWAERTGGRIARLGPRSFDFPPPAP